MKAVELLKFYYQCCFTNQSLNDGRIFRKTQFPAYIGLRCALSGQHSETSTLGSMRWTQRQRNKTRHEAVHWNRPTDLVLGNQEREIYSSFHFSIASFEITSYISGFISLTPLWLSYLALIFHFVTDVAIWHSRVHFAASCIWCNFLVI